MPYRFLVSLMTAMSIMLSGCGSAADRVPVERNTTYQPIRRYDDPAFDQGPGPGGDLPGSNTHGVATLSGGKTQTADDDLAAVVGAALAQGVAVDA